MSKIPRDSAAELPRIFAAPQATVAAPHWHFDSHEEQWLGETSVAFATEAERDKFVDALPAVVDVYIAWDRQEGVEVNEETLKLVAEKFGRVSNVRIPPERRLNSPDNGPTRPFGFISFLRPQDAASMCATKKLGSRLHARLAQVDKRNPVKRVPLEARVIEIYKM